MRVNTSQQVNDIHFFRQAKALLKLQIVLLKVHSVIQSRKLYFFFLLNVFQLIICWV